VSADQPLTGDELATIRPCDPLGGCVGAYFMAWQNRAVTAEAEVLRLVAEIERLRAQVERAEDACRKWIDDPDSDRFERHVASRILDEIS